MSISLNGFRVELSASEFTAYIEEMPDNQGLKPLRKQLGEEWFFHWSNGKVYGIPKVKQPKKSFGKPCKISCKHNLKLIKALINNSLPIVFSSYTPIKYYPFTLLGRKGELISSIANKFNNLPSLINKFKITPKFIIEPKIVELQRNETFMGLFLNIKAHWEILASLSELQNAGINLKGLYVVRKQRKPGERRLVGKISSVLDNVVYLSESYDNITQINESEVWLEASKQSFTRCLKTLLGSRYETFEYKRVIEETNLYNGLGWEKYLKILIDYLIRKFPVQLSPDLVVSIGSSIEANNDKNYQTVVCASPVEYCFDSARTKLHSNSWNGIKEYGPFSSDFFSKKSPEILVIFPDTVQGQVENFLRHFKDGISIRKKRFQNGVEEWSEVSQYSSGFGNIFRLVNPKLTLKKISWLDNTQKSPASAYKDAVKKILRNLESQPTKPDAAIAVILDEYTNLKEEENPFLVSKALLLMAGIPVQGIRVPTLLQPKESLQYTLRTFSVALYAKMKGIPWTVTQDFTINDELVIGIGTCELSNSRFSEKQRFVGITTVFRGDGNYLLGNLSDECSYSEYPKVLKESTLEILHEIKQRNGWLPGDTVRLVFHAARPLKNVDIANIIKECVAEVGSEQIVEFAFLTISHQHPFTLLDKSQAGILRKGLKKGTYVPERGTIVEIGRYTRLLCTTGAAQVKKPHAPLPKPLLLNLHKLSDYRDLTYLSEQVLKFTALSWRSLLPTRQPVTIYYSELIAKLLAKLRKIKGWSSALLNSLLRTSKWFI